jgi:hypothetical protein
MLRVHILLIAIVLVFLVPAQASANVGLPMIFPIGSTLLLALIPIIGIEAFVLWIRLGEPVTTALYASTAMNVVSTIIGIPVMWLTVGIGAALVPKPETRSRAKALLIEVLDNLFWIKPAYEKDVRWLIPAAILFYLLPLFIASRIIESRVAALVLGSVDESVVRDAVSIANGISYALLSLFPLVSIVRNFDQIKTKTQPPKVSLSHVGNTSNGWLVVGDTSGAVRLLDPESCEQKHVYGLNLEWIRSFSREGRYIAEKVVGRAPYGKEIQADNLQGSSMTMKYRRSCSPPMKRRWLASGITASSFCGTGEKVNGWHNPKERVMQIPVHWFTN